VIYQDGVVTVTALYQAKEDLSKGQDIGCLLLLFTWVLEIPGILFRWLLLLLVLFPLWAVFAVVVIRSDYLTIPGWQGRPDAIALTMLPEYAGFTLFLALSPLLLSLLAFVLQGGAWFTRFALGARDPSTRERELMQGALGTIGVRSDGGAIDGPSNWFVIDSPALNAYVVGTTLYVTRELLRSDHLPAVVAHELGHINSLDGKLTIALRRLVLPPVHYLSQLLKQPAPGNMVVVAAPDPVQAYIQTAFAWLISLGLSMLGGGFGLWALNPLWVWYWRNREYSADKLAAFMGFRGELIEFLEEHQYFDVAIPYFLSTHPYTELRIDKLLAYEANTTNESSIVESHPRPTPHNEVPSWLVPSTPTRAPRKERVPAGESTVSASGPQTLSRGAVSVTPATPNVQVGETSKSKSNTDESRNKSVNRLYPDLEVRRASQTSEQSSAPPAIEQPDASSGHLDEGDKDAKEELKRYVLGLRELFREVEQTLISQQPLRSGIETETFQMLTEYREAILRAIDESQQSNQTGNIDKGIAVLVEMVATGLRQNILHLTLPFKPSSVGLVKIQSVAEKYIGEYVNGSNKGEKDLLADSKLREIVHVYLHVYVNARGLDEETLKTHREVIGDLLTLCPLQDILKPAR
jgi:Zn-dependent protease with chaperone function